MSETNGGKEKCVTCEEVAEILDRFFAPVARALDEGRKVNENDLGPLKKCVTELMHIWLKLRPGSSKVGMMFAAAEASARRPQG